MSIADQAERENYSLFDDDGKPKSQATVLIDIAERFHHFHDADQNAYGVIEVDGVNQVWPVRSDGYKRHVSGEFFRLTGKGHNRNAYLDARDTIEARSINIGPTETVYLRVANLGDRIYLDMCDDKWRVIEIDAMGWRIIDRSPVKFVRKNGMTALPTPVAPGDVLLLREILNLSDADGHFVLVVGFILSALRGAGPFPILVMQGEQGTGKSTNSENIRRFIDPSTVPLRAPPKDPKDLLVSAVNAHLVCLDNLSGITPELSDCLCRFATGGGLDVRRLYSDTDQTLIQIQRPIIVNGIDDVTSRPDLSERSIILHLPVLGGTYNASKNDTCVTGWGSKRLSVKAIQEMASVLAPKIMAGLLDALSAAIRNVDQTVLDDPPRMADAALWVTAAEEALPWRTGAFIGAFNRMQGLAIEDGIEASPFASTLLGIMEARLPLTTWTVKGKPLYEKLTEEAGAGAKSKAWPMSEKGVRQALNRHAPSLRKMGLTFTKDKNHDREYHFHYDPSCRVEKQVPQPPHVPQPTDDEGLSRGTSGATRVQGAHRNTTEKKVPRPKPASGADSGTAGTSGTSRTNMHNRFNLPAGGDAPKDYQSAKYGDSVADRAPPKARKRGGQRI